MRNREVFRVGELAEADIAAIAAIEPPAEAAAFDHELTDADAQASGRQGVPRRAGD